MFDNKVMFVSDKVELTENLFLYVKQDDSKSENYTADIKIEITAQIYQEKEKMVSGMSSNLFLYAYKSEKE